VRIKFSARAWMLSIATGLVFLPTMDAEAQSGSRTVKQAVVTQTPEAEETEQQSVVKRQLNAIYSRFGRSKKSPIQQTAGEEVQGEPRRLNAEPSTRDAINESKPASRRLFPSLFPRKKQAAQAPAQPNAESNAAVNARLREMYERDGREVPAYMLEGGNSQPNRFQRVQPAKPVKSTKPARTADVEVPAAVASGTNSRGEIRQVSNNPFKRFFSKLNPLRRSSKSKPESEKPDRVEPLPQAARQERQRLEQGIIPPAPISPASNPAIQPRQIQKPVIELPAFDPELPAIDPPKAPALLLEKSALSPGELPEFKPAIDLEQKLDTIQGLEDVAIEEFDTAIEKVESKIPSLKLDVSDAPIGNAPIGNGVDPLDNPFPDLPEVKADVETKEDPFTGLTLETKNGSGSISAEAPALPQLPTIPDVSLIPEEPSLPELPQVKTEGLPRFDGNDLPEIKPEIKIESKKNDHSDKLNKIALRKELTGLKGFCPVDLRDNRGLTDALPEFKSEFEGATYNFSSMEAKAKFEKSPAKYAPTAGGHDVVKTTTDLEVAGSLDHAVWYKDRLYLFGSQDSLQTFVIDPAKYAVAK
jgi:YHS domain-containing protein